jgi:hypothetical protein
MKIVKYFFQDIPEKGEKAFKRFYLPLTVSIAASVFSIFLIYKDKFLTERAYQIENMILVLFLGVPFLVTVFLISEYFKFDQKFKCISGLTTIGLLITYYFSLPDNFLVVDTTRFVLISVFSFLSLFAFPSIIKADRYLTRKFALFLYQRMAFAAIVAILVYAGLSFAVYAIQILFIPDWHDSFRLTSAIFAASSGIIAPWVVMSGIPEIEKISEAEVVEKAAALISKFVFIPVVLFYLVILYIYFGKVLFFEELPKGMTSYLILSFCGAGSITYSIILEESKKAQKGITVFFEKWFYRTVFPLLFLLWYAIWKRTDDYGITEKRYILIVFSTLLTVWAVYFVLSRSKNVVVIPLFTALTSIFISFGPWGVFETSYRSQKTRIIEILEKNQLLENGKIIPATKEISFEDRKNLSSAFIYIENRWGLKRLSDIIPEKADISGTPQRFYARYTGESSSSFKLMKWMNIKYASEWETEKSSESFNFYLNNRDDYTITGPFDALIFTTCPKYSKHEKKEKEFQNFRTEFSSDCKILTIYEKDEKRYEKDLSEVIEMLAKNLDKTDGYNMTVDQITFSESSDPVNVHIVFTQAYGTFNSSGKVEKINNLALYIYYQLKK